MLSVLLLLGVGADRANAGIPLSLSLPRQGGGDVTRPFGGSLFFHDTAMHCWVTTKANIGSFRFPPPPFVGEGQGEGDVVE